MSEKVAYGEKSLVQRNEVKFLASPLGEEVVMMNTDNGDYIGVNSVGTDIWNLIAEPISVEQLVAKVGELYEVDEAQLKTELDEFLHRMLKHEMIIVTE